MTRQGENRCPQFDAIAALPQDCGDLPRLRGFIAPLETADKLPFMPKAASVRAYRADKIMITQGQVA